MAYQRALPSEMNGVHLVFHVSMLGKYIPDPSHVIQAQKVQLDEELSYEEVLMAIVDKQVRKLCSKEVPLIKVVWHNNS